jgi:hypothetical protein
MQYSIPILSAFLTAVIGTKMFPENVILSMGILLTVLGTFNSILKPAEGYEWTASFSNKFEEFENDLNLSMVELGARSETKESDYIQLLRTANHNLAKLIDERNKRQIDFFKSKPTEVVNELPVIADDTE